MKIFSLKTKLFAIFILALILISFLIYQGVKNSLKTYKVLKVVDYSTFYIDFNKNNKIDDDEKVDLYSIQKPLNYTDFNRKNISRKFLISYETYFKMTLFSTDFARKNLENKPVKVKVLQKHDNTQICELYIDNLNLAILLLKLGLALSLDNSIYFNYQNLDEMRKNAELNEKSVYILNNKNNILHKPNCKYAKLIKNYTPLLLADNELLNFKPCKMCANKIRKTKISSNFDIPKPKHIYKTSINKKFCDIELFLINPYSVSMPDTTCSTVICKSIVKEIKSSKTSIDAALYAFGNQKEILDNLIEAKNRGVKVRMVLDYSKNQDEIYPLSKVAAETFSAKRDSNKSLMHNKFIIFDNKKVFSGSVNISSTGTGGYNSNIAVIVDSSCLADMYQKEFENLYSLKFSTNKTEVKNSVCEVSSAKITPYFLPKNDFYNSKLKHLLSNAQKEVFVSAFYLTDYNFINELIKLKKKNIRVLVLMDSLGIMNFKNRIELLKKAQIPLKAENWGAKNHEKTIMIDSKILILGSANFSKSGFYKNDENILVIENPEIAALYRDYFLYLFNKIPDKYLKLYPRAEGKESINSCFDGIDNNFDGKIDSDDIGCK